MDDAKEAMMRYRLLTLLVLLCLTIPLHAQDDPSPYDIALQRIEEARISGAAELDLSRMSLTQLPSEIGQPTHLTWLDLSNNDLAVLPPEIGQLTNLQWLDLRSTKLSVLPPEIGQLTNLQVLYLDNNGLSALPAEIGQLSKLQWLILTNNNLSILPAEIGQLTNLQYLYLEGNNLRTLPPQIGRLSKLHGLRLNDNQLRHLPTELGNLILLADPNCWWCGLSVDGNPLISPPSEVVEQGTAAVLAYLRNQAWYHLQRLIISGASGIGLLAALVLGLRFRQQRRKPKQKRDDSRG